MVIFNWVRSSFCNIIKSINKSPFALQDNSNYRFDIHFAGSKSEFLFAMNYSFNDQSVQVYDAAHRYEIQCWKSKKEVALSIPVQWHVIDTASHKKSLWNENFNRTAIEYWTRFPYKSECKLRTKFIASPTKKWRDGNYERIDPNTLNIKSSIFPRQCISI